METEFSKNKVKYELISSSPAGSKIVFPITKRRSLLGRGQACDIVIPFGDVSTIHAVLEITKNGKIKVYDLNSKNGTLFNGQKVIVGEVSLGKEFFVGDNKVLIKEFEKNDILPPPLAMLDRQMILESKSEEPPTSLPVQPPPSVVNQEEVVIPTVQYPLAKDPQAEFSEYIFEDVEHLYPIFKYEVGGSAVEIIIVFNDRIQSVDYVPLKDGMYTLVGSGSGSKEVEYPYLGKGDKVPFIQVKNGEAEVLPLDGYKAQALGDQKRENLANPFFLYDEEIVQFSNQHIQIFLRKTYSPPKVAPAPILRRDSEFKKYLLLMFFLVLSFLVPFSLFEVDDEIEKEKAPERIATILYKRKLTVSKSPAIDKTKNAPKKVQKSPKQVAKKQPKNTKQDKISKKDNKKTNVKKAGDKKSTKVGKIKKATPNKGPKDVKKNIVRPTTAKKAGGKRGSRNVKKASSAITKSKGSVDTYKSFDFKSTVSSLISKGGSTKTAKAVAADASGSTSNTSISDANPGATLKTAKVSKNTGSLSGVASGKLDTAKGVEGLVNKKSIYTAGLPYKTVIVGGIDPDVIRQILIENIPRFRYCYQKVLDRSKAAFNGIVRLNFIIGASGHVTKAGVDSISSLPSTVKGCVVNVLRKISFPPPMGGGVVEVNQPMNFYPRVK
jgi:hypothetical protein